MHSIQVMHTSTCACDYETVTYVVPTPVVTCASQYTVPNTKSMVNTKGGP